MFDYYDSVLTKNVKHAQKGAKVNRNTYFMKQKHHKIKKANQLKSFKKGAGDLKNAKIGRRNSEDDSNFKPKDRKGFLKYEQNRTGQMQRTKKRKGIQVLYISIIIDVNLIGYYQSFGMEYCEGKNLKLFLKEGLSSRFQSQQSSISQSSLSAQKQQQQELSDLKWKIFSQIVDALHYIHELGLIHRDLKPQNIFLDKNNQNQKFQQFKPQFLLFSWHFVNNVKLGDFGLATHHSHIANALSNSVCGESHQVKVKKHPKNVMHSVGIGTPMYMAPEQKQGRTGEYDQMADMFSLGLIFFEIELFKSDKLHLHIVFEIWVGGFNTIIEMKKAFDNLADKGVIEQEYQQKIPQNALQIIKRLTCQDPCQRMTTTQLLQRFKL